jgi:hypothetical protein
MGVGEFKGQTDLFLYSNADPLQDQQVGSKVISPWGGKQTFLQDILYK